MMIKNFQKYFFLVKKLVNSKKKSYISPKIKKGYFQGHGTK